jgi:hypothetical protein
MFNVLSSDPGAVGFVVVNFVVDVLDRFLAHQVDFFK